MSKQDIAGEELDEILRTYDLATVKGSSSAAFETAKAELKQLLAKAERQAIQAFGEKLIDKLLNFTAEHDRPMRDEATTAIQEAIKETRQV